MNCFLFISILLLSIIGQVFGRIVTFSLISFGNQVSVTFQGKTLEMKPIDDFSNVFAVSTNCPDEDIQYSYTVDGTTEGFQRVLKKGELQTYNEFFEREETIKPLIGMGYPDDKPQWTRSIGKTNLFDDSYIPTVIIDNESREFFVSGNDTWTLGRFTIILKDEVFSETNVPTKAQNRYQDKFQFRIKLENKIHKRRVFKFRSNPNDPVFIRQSLYADALSAVGNPVHNQIIVRVYLKDGTPIGLYLMIEVTSSKSFIKTQFYGDEATEKVNVPSTGLGYPLDAGMGSDFIPGGNFVKFKADEGESNERVIRLADAMAAVDVNDEQSVQKFHKEWLDLDIFFKALALEYLTGHWDSYWMFQTNFVMYDAPEESTPNTYRFYFLDQDFDLTFGVSLPSAINTFGDDFPNQSYKTLVNRSWSISEYDGPTRAAIDKFLNGGITTTMFENHLIDIVKHVFNPVALGRRIDQYVERYSKEIEWDYQQPRLHIASDPEKTRYVWAINDYYENLDSTPKLTCRWGLKQYIEARAQAVANEFQFQWDTTPIEPKAKVIAKGNNADNSNVVSGSISIKPFKTSLIMVTLTTILIGLLFI
ncbi:hypothetical protein BCR32DRAFT_298677 [Anaeromyces robustus]|jgi:hypothetical protein|uniref:Coth-domain-containing protein n=1 Tax=Anaeromyces robustus TaxID=1754192 RepID=A0A1Y1V007_9FUNG|nr:hypothetical protein BCR32DRAFT_298677 [Anaeromyces robustus]|eukprot:ORX43450.1 hypothetical protein BCR32DRAFT_298677 [Anaeromyces robustus]